jgi:hypothetical protein
MQNTLTRRLEVEEFFAVLGGFGWIDLPPKYRSRSYVRIRPG